MQGTEKENKHDESGSNDEINEFAAFLKAVFSRGIEEGTVIEITVQRLGESPITSNIKVKDSDLELLQSLKDMGN